MKFTFTSLGYFNFIERGSSVRPVFLMGSGSDSDPVEGFIQQRKGGRRKYIIGTHPPPLLLKLYDSM
jgi:hypothetical protein